MIVVQEYLESKLEALTKENDLFPDKVHPDLLTENFDLFKRRRDEYDRKWLKYKNQIFGILNLDVWRPAIEQWIERICPADRIDEHHYLDLSALETFTHNLLASQYPHVQDPNVRMCTAILREQGYIAGIGTLKELFEEETNEATKEILKNHIDAYELLQPHRDYLISCIGDSDVQKILHEWMDNEKLSVAESYMILTELSTAIYFLKGFDYNDQIQDKLNEVLEELYDMKNTDNGG